MDYLFGPLSKEYCIWFYFLSIINFVFLVVLIIASIIMGISKRKGSDYYFQMFTVAVGYAVFYFQNRLLFSMCSGSV